ncbi:MAG: nitrous oxide reductase family maturation protein NosD [Chitinophagales bacterium]|nr:nitrous oxide reductase family maturation protein NosD [Chitinophagales bacterium]MBP9190537.1 nitrous oxide reductase family maturation protein NosD [Chitinophagales bacterium]MBP9549256.1 nitrous oxide reductase family maturation protein NosD [Chitinophagales bacterium]MBP9705478.1 nitrous oxide reductase family maturation protein NosD [Chitinophagales bacterium]
MKYSAIFFVIIVLVCVLPAQTVSDNSSAEKTSGILQQKIDAASPYDTLIIDGGIYKEFNVVIKKPLVIIGKNYPVLEIDYKGEGFIIESDSVTIDGWVIQHSKPSDLHENAAIRLSQVKHIQVLNNKITDNYFCIYLAKSDSSIVKNNTIKSIPKSENTSGNGVHLWKCDAITIENNTITGTRDGIYLEFVSNSIISGNNCFKNIRYGLHFMFSNDDAYLKNVFTENGAGVAVMYSKGVQMHNNTFQKNRGSSSFGLLLKDITDSEIEGNTFYDNAVAIHMEGSNRVLAKQNSILENGWGLVITANCTDVAFEKNNFISNSFDVSTNGTLVLNTFNGNYWDKYEGYDLDRDAMGDVPYHPVSLFAIIVDKIPEAIMLYRSFAQYLIDKAEKILPGLTPENLVDKTPYMKPVQL